MKTNLIAVKLKSNVGLQPTGDGVVELDKIISTVIGVLTLVAFIYFVIQVILAGYAFISGQGDEKKIESARKRLTDGILGITIVVIAFGVGALLASLMGLDNIFDLNTIFDRLFPIRQGSPNVNLLGLQSYIHIQ